MSNMQQQQQQHPLMNFLSPTTRRRHRGRGTVVLDNLSGAIQMNNFLATDAPNTSSLSSPSAAAARSATAADNVGINTAAAAAAVAAPVATTTVLSPYLDIISSSRSASGGPSPDEIVIQARGRRMGVPITFSPDVHTTPNSWRRSGGGGAGAGGIINSRRHIADATGAGTAAMSRLLLPTRRSSPRKRLTLTDSPPPKAAPALAAAAASFTPSPERVKRSPVTKKLRFTSLSSSSSTTTTTTEAGADLIDPLIHMKALNQAQLADVVGKLMTKYPGLDADVRSMLPPPDLTPMEEKLLNLKRNIFKSLPNTRLESKTDSLAYNRVSGHLLAFKKSIIEQSKTLLDGHCWSSAVDYALMAWSYVKATPLWDNPVHNNIRKQLMKSLALNCLQALKKGHWNIDIAIEIKEKLRPLEKDSAADIKPCIRHLEQIISNAGSQN